MPMNNLIIIDGISNAGKTTFCTSLIDDNTVLVDEVPLFIKKNAQKYHRTLLPTMPKTIEEEKYNQNILYQAEIDRFMFAHSIICAGKTAVMDRSFLSTVAMAYALDHQNPFKGSYDNAMLLLKEYIFLIQRLQPWDNIIFVILDAQKDQIESRNETRGNPLSPEWINEEMLAKERAFFKTMCDEVNGLFIDTSNLTIDEIRDILNRKISTIKRRRKKNS